MTLFLTSKENIAITLLFEWLDEDRYNRTMDDYAAIAARVPTTCQGYRLATSVGGTLTGRSGEFVIIDDPIKP